VPPPPYLGAMSDAKDTRTTPGCPVMDDTSRGHASTVEVLLAKNTGPDGDAAQQARMHRNAYRHTQGYTDRQKGRKAHPDTHRQTGTHRHTCTHTGTQARRNTHKHGSTTASKGTGHHSAPQAAPRQYRRSTLCQHTELGEGQQYAQDAVMVMRPPPMLLRVLCATPPRDTDDRVDTRIPPMTCD
jgi:hypothetical protein